MNESYIILGCVALVALGLAYLVTFSTETAEASITLKPKEPAVVFLGKQVYAQNCTSCHGVALEVQANWRQRGDDGGTCPRHLMMRQGIPGTIQTPTCS